MYFFLFLLLSESYLFENFPLEFFPHLNRTVARWTLAVNIFAGWVKIVFNVNVSQLSHSLRRGSEIDTAVSLICD